LVVYNLSMLRNRKVINEIHIAIIGANGSGKSALTVKFMTKRYIGEYDPNMGKKKLKNIECINYFHLHHKIEQYLLKKIDRKNTYCKQITINGNECMLWIMDTVEGSGKSSSRYVSWADVFLVLYSVTNRDSFEYAEKLLKEIHSHDHSVCVRPHIVCLIGNKIDLDRYRQVSKNQGAIMATMYSAKFYEINVTEEYSMVKNLFRDLIEEVIISRDRMTSQRSPNSRVWMNQRVTDEILSSEGAQNLKNVIGRRPKSPSVKVYDTMKIKMAPSIHQKKSSGLKILKLFQERYRETS
ncbi:Ras-like protein family member 12, partial [Trichinella nelsoni]